ncbi:hypothetical protein AAVH_18071 [Aphelenchoides avenae]|nr:hypothetical protein AAVH_18071 [Aphelenchus avenae]
MPAKHILTEYRVEKTANDLAKLADLLFDATHPKHCDIVFSARTVDDEWFDTVIERFESSEQTATAVASISVLWNLNDDYVPDTHRLQAPSSTTARPPRKDFVEDLAALLDAVEYKESPVHLFTFRNALNRKVLHVYKWAVVVTNEAGKYKSAALLFETT